MVETEGAAARAAVRLRRCCAGYMAVQAVLGVCFWVLLAASDPLREWLELMPEHPPVTDAFAVADIAAVVVASAASAYAIDARRAWAVPAVFFAAGGIVYPTLYLVGWVLFSSTGTGAPLLVAMTAVSAATCWVASQTWRLSRSGLL